MCKKNSCSVKLLDERFDHNTTKMPERDLIFNKRCLHGSKNPHGINQGKKGISKISRF